MNKLDLELFEILDSEIDKTLSFGCFIKGFDGDYHKFVELEDEGGNGYNYWYINLEKNMLLDEYIDKDIFKEKTEILGHYPTTNEVLRYVYKNKLTCDLDCGYEGEPVLRIYKGENFNLDITKPIQQYTDKQKQELIDFLKKIK